MLSRRVIEKHIRKELNEYEWSKLVKAEYGDVLNWMIYHSRDKAS